MKKFLIHSAFLILGIFMLLFLLDALYTYVYTNAIPRNKTQYILSLKEGETIDYVFLGSSRVENSIMSSKIEELTGKEVLNLGTQGARLQDITLYLKLLIDKKIKISRIFIQVDYIYNYESSSDIVRSQTIPYIRSNPVVKDYLKQVDSNYIKNYYVPFYRYAANDYKLGFREFFVSLVNKKPKINFEDGFVPLFGVMKKKEGAKMPATILKTNKSLAEIDSICKTNHVEVTYFCSPFCSNLESNDYLQKLKSKLPNFEDFSRVIQEDSLFQNCGHLNKAGAERFSSIIVKKLGL